MMAHTMTLKTILPILFLCACTNTGNSETSTGTKINMRIVTLDSNHEPFIAESVRWWHTDEKNKRQSLTCNATTGCTEWFLRDDFSSPLIISANTSLADSKRTHCWKLYHGEVSLKQPMKEVKIVMRYTNTACRSQKSLRL